MPPLRPRNEPVGSVLTSETVSVGEFLFYTCALMMSVRYTAKGGIISKKIMPTKRLIDA
jgi:hypothetical protein